MTFYFRVLNLKLTGNKFFISSYIRQASFIEKHKQENTNKDIQASLLLFLPVAKHLLFALSYSSIAVPRSLQSFTRISRLPL